MELENVIQLLPTIPPNRHYWFIRTKGGLWYENFIKEGYVGISWDKITIEDIKLGFDKLLKKLEDTYKSTSTHTANQLLKFSNEVKKGDIVLIPSKNSSIITFGEIIDDTLFEEKINNKLKIERPGFKTKIITFPEKRKKVNWLKTIDRKKLDSELYNLIFSHHTISDGSPYADYIDKTLHRFYIKDDQAHLILEVKTRNGIKAKKLFETGLEILNVLDDFNSEIKGNYDSNEIEIKINVQSPGDMQFTGKVKSLVILGTLLVGICGGGFKFVGLEINTDGLIKNIIQYQDRSFERKAKEDILKQNLTKLEIQTPDELAKVYESLATKPIQSIKSLPPIEEIRASDSNSTKKETLLEDVPSKSKDKLLPKPTKTDKNEK